MFDQIIGFFEQQQLIFFYLGVLLFVMGLLAVLGIWKNWYWRNRQSLVYGYVFFGIASMIASYHNFFMEMLGQREWVLNLVYILLVLLGALISVKTPKFLKPYWVQEIEKQPPWVYKAMVVEASQGRAWREHFKNRETFQAWIKEIKRNPPEKKKKKKK